MFGDRHSGSHMHRFSRTGIVRHQLVKQGASPDDPELVEYWAERRRKPVPPINNTSRRASKPRTDAVRIYKFPLFAEQPHPNRREQVADEHPTTITIVKPVTGTPDTDNHRPVHAECNDPAPLPAYQPSRLA